MSILALWKRYALVQKTDDKTIRFWDVGTYECFKILETNYNGISQIFLLPNGYFIFGTFGSQAFSSFAIYDMRSYKCVNTSKGHRGTVTCFLLFKDKRLVSGSQDSTVIIWEY
jgi:WD40 repeat protein